ncbi:hypothetical protein TsFJ059_000227 [Trichoderma semiorbis]|uniref:Uncharacterized protein n=1 Tax=Trichoderma semiorbis TaxID=1491008 RepID=A0A9P8HWT4_9HYPO|nr:hypothetical protein TsFJ059_000227 [Trichoderma semiorbis]
MASRRHQPLHSYGMNLHTSRSYLVLLPEPVHSNIKQVSPQLKNLLAISKLDTFVKLFPSLLRRPSRGSQLALPVKPHPPMIGRPEPSTATQSSSFLRGTSSGKRIEQQHSNAFRAKPNTHARMQRYSTQFNELDITPNSHADESWSPSSSSSSSSLLKFPCYSACIDAFMAAASVQHA